MLEYKEIRKLRDSLYRLGIKVEDYDDDYLEGFFNTLLDSPEKWKKLFEHKYKYVRTVPLKLNRDTSTEKNLFSDI